MILGKQHNARFYRSSDPILGGTSKPRIELKADTYLLLDCDKEHSSSQQETIRKILQQKNDTIPLKYCEIRSASKTVTTLLFYTHEAKELETLDPKKQASLKITELANAIKLLEKLKLPELASTLDSEGLADDHLLQALFSRDKELQKQLFTQLNALEALRSNRPEFFVPKFDTFGKIKNKDKAERCDLDAGKTYLLFSPGDQSLQESFKKIEAQVKAYNLDLKCCYYSRSSKECIVVFSDGPQLESLITYLNILERVTAGGKLTLDLLSPEKLFAVLPTLDTRQQQILNREIKELVLNKYLGKPPALEAPKNKTAAEIKSQGAPVNVPALETQDEIKALSYNNLLLKFDSLHAKEDRSETYTNTVMAITNHAEFKAELCRRHLKRINGAFVLLHGRLTDDGTTSEEKTQFTALQRATSLILARLELDGQKNCQRHDFPDGPNNGYIILFRGTRQSLLSKIDYKELYGSILASFIKSYPADLTDFIEIHKKELTSITAELSDGAPTPLPSSKGKPLKKEKSKSKEKSYGGYTLAQWYASEEETFKQYGIHENDPWDKLFFDGPPSALTQLIDSQDENTLEFGKPLSESVVSYGLSSRNWNGVLILAQGKKSFADHLKAAELIKTLKANPKAIAKPVSAAIVPMKTDSEEEDRETKAVVVKSSPEPSLSVSPANSSEAGTPQSGKRKLISEEDTDSPSPTAKKQKVEPSSSSDNKRDDSTAASVKLEPLRPSASPAHSNSERNVDRDRQHSRPHDDRRDDFGHDRLKDRSPPRARDRRDGDRDKDRDRDRDYRDHSPRRERSSFGSSRHSFHAQPHRRDYPPHSHQGSYTPRDRDQRPRVDSFSRKEDDYRNRQAFDRERNKDRDRDGKREPHQRFMSTPR